MIAIIPLLIIIGFIAWLLKPQKNSSKPRIYAILSVGLVPLTLAATSVAFSFTEVQLFYLLSNWVCWSGWERFSPDYPFGIPAAGSRKPAGGLEPLILV
jgi:hypothetical protein